MCSASKATLPGSGQVASANWVTAASETALSAEAASWAASLPGTDSSNSTPGRSL